MQVQLNDEIGFLCDGKIQHVLSCGASQAFFPTVTSISSQVHPVTVVIASSLADGNAMEQRTVPGPSARLSSVSSRSSAVAFLI